MAFSEPHQYLIAYDIADPRRLSRVHRYLKDWAVPVQNSVFTAVLRQAQVEIMVAGIERIIDEGEDDVRIYPLPRNFEVTVIGQSYLPMGVHLFSNSAEITFPSDKLEDCVATG